VGGPSGLRTGGKGGALRLALGFGEIVQFFVRQEIGQPLDPLRVAELLSNRPIVDNIAVIDAQSCSRRKACGCAIRPAQAPGLNRHTVAQECLIRRLFGRCWSPNAIKIGGGRDQDAPVVGELAHHGGAVRERTDPDRNIEALADEIDHSVVESQCDGETGIDFARYAIFGASPIQI
jgi:hypothetical protein